MPHPRRIVVEACLAASPFSENASLHILGFPLWPSEGGVKTS
jgi:hypothetical protein